MGSGHRVWGVWLILALGATNLLAQGMSPEEDGLYRSWYQANQTGDLPKALELTREYLKKFPRGANAAYLRDQWLPPSLSRLFNEATRNRDCDALVAATREMLTHHPDNLDFPWLCVAQLRQLEFFAPNATFVHAPDAQEFSRLLIGKIEAGARPPVVPATQWSAGASLAVLYQTLAYLEANAREMAPSIAHYHRSTELDPGNRNLATYNLLACGVLHNAQYREASMTVRRLQEACPANADPNPELAAALELANTRADAVIECWVKFLALTATRNSYGRKREEIHKIVEELWNYRHPNDPTGLAQQIQAHTPAEAEESK